MDAQRWKNSADHLACFCDRAINPGSRHLVYRARDYVERLWNLDIPQFAYIVVLLVCMLGGYWLSTGKIVRELQADSRRKRATIRD
jgi:hypothetical protein